MDNHPNLKQFSLSGNPWSCDCNTLKFKNWLASNIQNVRILEYLKNKFLLKVF